MRNKAFYERVNEMHQFLKERGYHDAADGVWEIVRGLGEEGATEVMRYWDADFAHVARLNAEFNRSKIRRERSRRTWV